MQDTLANTEQSTINIVRRALDEVKRIDEEVQSKKAVELTTLADARAAVLKRKGELEDQLEQVETAIATIVAKSARRGGKLSMGTPEELRRNLLPG